MYHLKKIIPLFPKHKTYIEPFCGGCSVLLNKSPVPIEVINDLDGDLINFWRVVRDHHKEFIHSFDYTLCSREVFQEYLQRFKRAEYDNDIQRAHIFYYINRACYAAKMDSPSYGVSGDRHSSLRISGIEDTINRVYERLKDAQIECLPFDDLMPRYDNECVLFFLDPPYHTGQGYRVGSFDDDSYQQLADICAHMKGKFLMTINDDDFIREVFKGFNIVAERDVKYSLDSNAKTRRKSKELIITNYDCVQTM